MQNEGVTSQQDEQRRNTSSPTRGYAEGSFSPRRSSGKNAREVQAELQVKYEPALAQNAKEMQQNAIHLRHPGCGLAKQTSKGVDDMLRVAQEAEQSSK